MPGGARTNAKGIAIAGLAVGLTAPEVAKQCGVHECTVRRWLKRPDVQAQVEAARRDLVSQTVGRLSDSTTQAVQTLRQLLSADTPPATRLGAARAILEMAAKWRESEELERRLTALEEIIETRR